MNNQTAILSSTTTASIRHLYTCKECGEQQYGVSHVVTSGGVLSPSEFEARIRAMPSKPSLSHVSLTLKRPNPSWTASMNSMRHSPKCRGNIG